MLVMARKFADIQVIGFDLDQTLYPKSPKIDEAIQDYLYKCIAEVHECTYEQARQMFTSRYKDGKGMSGSQTMQDLRIPNASEVVQEALEKADIAEFLMPNQKTIHLLKELKKHFSAIDLITGSAHTVCMSKLDHLAIDPKLFDHIITADDASKSSGDAYKQWLLYYPSLAPASFLYIGDRPRSDVEVPNELGISSILVNQRAIDQRLDNLQLATLHDISDYLLAQ